MEEKKSMKSKPHGMSVENREKLTITGVRDVMNFDDNTIVLDTEMGGLVIKGTGLHINKLNVDDGNLFIEGFVTSCAYTDKSDSKKTGNFFGNMFK